MWNFNIRPDTSSNKIKSQIINWLVKGDTGQARFHFYEWDLTICVLFSLILEVVKLLFQALRLSAAAKRETSAGQINNLISTDCLRFQEFPMQATLLWIAPLKVNITQINFNNCINRRIHISPCMPCGWPLNTSIPNIQHGSLVDGLVVYSTF